MRKKIILLIFLFLSTVILSAQEISGSPKDQPKGFRFSENTYLNINFSLMPEYSTNITRLSEKTEAVNTSTGEMIDSMDPVSDLIIHFAPGLKLKIDDMYKTLGMAVSIDYSLYTLHANEEAAKNTMKKFSTVTVSSEIVGELNKDSFAKIKFLNKFNRNSSPNSLVIDGLHSNLTEDFEASLFLVNSEDTLLMRISTGTTLQFFEETSMGFDKYNYYNSKSSLFGRWKFLPKTSVFFNASFIYQDYYNANKSIGSEPNANPRLREDLISMPLNAIVGLEGQITSKFSLKFGAGYSNTFSYDMKQDFVTNTELIFKFTENTLGKLGYNRAYLPTPTFQYYKTDKIYLDLKQKLFSSRLLLSLEGNFQFVNFGNSVEYNNATTTSSGSAFTYTGTTRTTTISSLDRADMIMAINPSVSFNITRWIGLKLDYILEKRWSDYNRIDVTNNKTVTTFNDYIDNRIMFTAQIDY